MTDTPTYPMRWRGRETGDFSIADIEERLDAHEIGLWHEIQHEGRWVTLREFIDATGKISRALKRKAIVIPPLEAEQEAEAAAATKGLSRRWRMAYATVGLLYPTISLIVALFATTDATAAMVYAGIGMGLHNLYASRWLVGALQIAIALTFVSLGWTTLWLGFWPAIEVIFIWRDGRGFAMK